jgi:tight adherence protein C
MMLLLALAVASGVGAASLVAAQVLAPRRELRRSLARVSAYGGGVVRVDDRPARRLGLVEPLARVALRFSPSASLDDAAAKLAAAGLIRKLSPTAFYALKTSAVIGGAALGLLTAASSGSVARALLGASGLAAAGLIVPDLLLSGRIRRRRERILDELPNALDLLAVSVEAGLGLDAAVARLVDASSGPLTDEFALLLAELRVGAGRHEVLKRFADRVAAPEVAAFARAVAHADRLGASLTQTMRTQAHETRLRRQAAAEEKAGKAPVRMLFPTVFFIFPALFVVVLGPALIYLTQTL